MLEDPWPSSKTTMCSIKIHLMINVLRQELNSTTGIRLGLVAIKSFDYTNLGYHSLVSFPLITTMKYLTIVIFFTLLAGCIAQAWIGSDENKDGVNDAFDQNRDGKFDSYYGGYYGYPGYYGYIGFPHNRFFFVRH